MKRRKKAISAAGKREGKRRNESRRPASEPSGGGRCDAGGGGVTGSAVTPDAGSRPEPSNAQRPPRRRRRRRRRRAASPPETNTSCLIFHARGPHPFLPFLSPPPSFLPCIHHLRLAVALFLSRNHATRAANQNPPPPRTYRPGSRGWVWIPSVAGRVRLSWSVLAPAPLAGRIPRCVPRQHFVSVVCKLC